MVQAAASSTFTLEADMRALIDPRFNRVCQLADEDFPVADPLFWVDADESVMPDATTYCDGQFIAAIPVAVPEPQPDPLAVLKQAVKDKLGLTDADLDAAAVKVAAADAAELSAEVRP